MRLFASAWFDLALPAIVEGFFAFWFGAAVGSFVNVLAYRIPEGLSVVRPPSRCPKCGRLLTARENLPVIGWLLLRGKCRGCAQPISVQYPLVELLVGIVTVWLYVILYHAEPTGWWASGTSSWWRAAGLLGSLPAAAGLVVLIGGMAAVALCDAARFLVPMSLVRWVAGVGVSAWVVQSAFSTRPSGLWPPIPAVSGVWQAVTIGATLGLVLANVLLWKGWIRRSFSDYEQFVDEGQTLGDYPHARREMKPELAFMGVIAAGGVAGWYVRGTLGAPLPHAGLEVLVAALAGYLAGGAIVWCVRVAGTLAFGREAMGLGDVHILAAAGAVLGWRDPLLAFLIAPFPALAWTILQRCFRPPSARSELPFGPYLVVGLAVVLLLRPALMDLAQLLQWIPADSAANVHAYQ